jgi:uncharacterized protein (TIGR03905 family)
MEVFKTSGVCSSEIQFEIEAGVVKNVSFVRGCPGSLTAITELVKDKAVAEVISKLKGIRCGDKETSCPDQLAKALEAYL